MKEIRSKEEFDEIMNGLILKHSTQCPVSATAYEEVVKFEENSDADVFFLKVIECRDLSNYIEAKTGIKHESPQVLLMKDKKIVWDASHGKITEDEIRKHL